MTSATIDDNTGDCSALPTANPADEAAMEDAEVTAILGGDSECGCSGCKRNVSAAGNAFTAEGR